MSAILEAIRKDQLQFRKDRNTVGAAILTTLMGDLENASKSGKGTLDDVTVIAKLKNYVSNAETTLAALPDTAPVDFVERTKTEIGILTSYIPAQLTEDELTVVIAPLKAEGQKIGQIMGFLKANYAGRYDASAAQKIINS